MSAPRRYVQLPLDHYDDDRRIGCDDAAVLVAETVLAVATKRLESDGRITRLQARRELAGLAFVESTTAAIAGLIKHGLAIEIDGQTIELTDWRSFMASAEEMEELRETRRRAGREGGLARAANLAGTAVASAKHVPGDELASAKHVPGDELASASPLLQHVVPTRPDPTRPDPELIRPDHDQTTTRPDADATASRATKLTPDEPQPLVSSSSVVDHGLQVAAERVAGRKPPGSLKGTVANYARGIQDTWRREQPDVIRRAVDEGWSAERVAEHFDAPRSVGSLSSSGSSDLRPCDPEHCGEHCRLGYAGSCVQYQKAGWTRQTTTCAACNGDGIIESGTACSVCRGQGSVSSPARRLTVVRDTVGAA